MTDKRHPDPNKDGRDQYKRHIDGSVRVSGQIEVHPPPDSMEEDKADRGDQKTHRNKAYVVSLLTLGSVIVYAGITFWQGCMSRELIDDTNKHFQADQRPYVWYGGSFDQIGLHVVENEKLMLDIHWVNYGRSPAINVGSKAAVFIGPQAMQQADDWFTNLGDKPLPVDSTTRLVIPPGIPADPIKTFGGYSTIEKTTALTHEEAEYILGHNEPLALVERIDYYDGAGKRYWSDLCFSRFKNGSIPLCNRHNEMH